MGSLRKCHAVVLLPVIGIFALAMIGLGGAAYNTHYEAKTWGGNIVSSDLMGYSIVAGVLAIVLVISGAWYAFGKAESWVSAASASTTSLVAWGFALLAFGFACRQAAYGDSKLHAGYTVEGFEVEVTNKLSGVSKR